MSHEFIQFARTCGLDLIQIQECDKVCRCPTFNRPKKKNGAYMMRQDGNGWCIAYDMGGELQWFSDPKGPHVWTQAEKDDWKRRESAARADRTEGYAKAARTAQEMMRLCHLGPNGYLHRKGFPELQSLCLDDGALFVPMRSLTGAIVGAQIVRWLPDEMRFEKKFIPSMRAKGAVLRLGRNDKHATILCEGYATGLSIKAACEQMNLVHTVLVTFSDGNMVHVAEILENAPFRRCVIADSDESGAGEKAAKATGLPYAMPEVVGYDANDVHQKSGLLAVCRLVMDAMRKS